MSAIRVYCTNLEWCFCRQLGKYKKSMRNTRYLEGSIAEQYLVHESVTYCKSYLRRMDNEDIDTSIAEWNISCVSLLVRPDIIETRRQFRLTEA